MVFILLCLHSTVAQQVASVPFQVFHCRYKTVAEMEQMLREILPTDKAIRLVVDTERNELLLRGPQSAMQIATELFRAVDQPPPAPAAPIKAAKTTIQTYHCPAAQQPRVLGQLRARFAHQANVRITADAGTGRLFVLAPPQVHQAIRRQLSASTAGKAPNSVPPPVRAGRVKPTLSGSPADRHAQAAAPRPPGRLSPSGSARPVADDVRQVFLPLVSEPQEVEHRLTALLGERLQRFLQDGKPRLRLKLNALSRVDFAFDLRRRGVNVTGSDRPLRQVAQLISALDQAGRDPARRTSVVSIRRTDPVKLRKAVDAFLSRPPAQPATDDSGYSRSSRTGHVALAAHTPVEEPRQPAAGENAAAEKPLSLNDLSVDVDVQTLPDLDVIILRGRDREVQKLTEIIRQLERLSEQTQPKVHIYQLRHARSESISQIIAAVSPDLVGGRQGRVTVTPLVKPNALLLIGWGEAVDSIVDLIARLDTPVSPGSQFAVFRLQHAAVTIVQQTLQTFFTGRTGLGPMIQMTADVRTNSLIVYAAPRDMAEVRELIKSLDTPQSEVTNQVQIFEIKNALAAELAATLQMAIQAARGGTAAAPSAALELLTRDARGQRMLRSGILNRVQVTPNVRNNTLIVAGPADSMELIAALIRELDRPAAVSQIKVFRIKNADASSLVQMLRSLLPSGTAGSTPQLPTAEGETSLAPLRFSVDIRTNTIIATGSEGDLRIIEGLLLRLDQEDLSQRKNEVYRLKNAPANEVAASINLFLRSERTVQQAAPGTESPFEQIERQVIVVPEPVVNALIISATPRYFDDIMHLIEQLDAQPAEVMIEVLIAEVTLKKADEFGVELGLQDSVLFDRSLLSDIQNITNTAQQSTPSGIITVTEQIIQSALNTPGFNFNNVPFGNSGSDTALQRSHTVGAQGLSNFDLGRMNNDLGFGGLVLSAGSDSVSVLIRALQASSRVQILSRPHVRTLDNQPAFIQVGQRVPRVSGTAISQGGFQNNSITYENVGLILGVTPRISPDETVVMEIDAEKSEVGSLREGIPVAFGPDNSPILSPRINTTQAQTTVSAASGETIVLGGLITKKDQDLSRRVPYLSDIPLVGNLFRYDGANGERAELLIILTPHVILSSEDSEQIKQTEMARMSWCAAHVYDIYGDIGLTVDKGHPAADGQTEVIYPDLNPRGTAEPYDRLRAHGPPADSTPLPPPAISPPGRGATRAPRAEAPSSDYPRPIGPLPPPRNSEGSAASRWPPASARTALVRAGRDLHRLPPANVAQVVKENGTSRR